MSAQHPLLSGFGAKTTTREVIGEQRLDGATAIVTGGYAGIGLETARVLAAAGAEVVVPARDIAKAMAALSGLANVTIDELDLAVPATIDAFAVRFGGKCFERAGFPFKNSAEGGFTASAFSFGVDEVAAQDPDLADIGTARDAKDGGALGETFHLENVHQALALNAAKTVLRGLAQQ